MSDDPTAEYVDCTCGHARDDHNSNGCFPTCGCTRPGPAQAAEHAQPVYVPERGYWLGPDLPMGEPAWPLFWEQQEGLDDCLHVWERVVLNRAQSHNGPEPVVRCRLCSAPRCGDSTDRDPCMERRHHRTTHLTLHGSFEPVGGYLKEARDA